MENIYCKDFIQYNRRDALPVKVGNIIIGGTSDICVQTMTNTATSDVEKTVAQIISSNKAGAQLVRITVPSKKDIEALKLIKSNIVSRGYQIPLVADIHFNQELAFEAAKIVDKVRINPGNFADSKSFTKHDYNDIEYKEELIRVRQKFIPLLEICKEYNTSLRIGSNHGSLSDRIMSRYGDTPEGMAESAMEFLRFCKEENFENVIISMKASNTLIMVQATRLLVAKMDAEEMKYPLHLGVTEAGEGEDGRIKSAIGVGALLADGIGDTIRISLTEPPESEIPVANKLLNYLNLRKKHKPIESFENYTINPYSYNRRKTIAFKNIGGNNVPVVISSVDLPNVSKDIEPDYILKSEDEIHKAGFYMCYADEVEKSSIEKFRKFAAIILRTRNENGFSDQRAAIVRLINANIMTPVILHREYMETDLESFQIKASADLGGLFLDGLADGIWIENTGDLNPLEINSTAFGILQASRMRITKPEYISCPSCGRTMFGLQETTQKIREKTSHLKGLKIGIMGCIVNGLGEMADADYGYIGSGVGKINLYYNKDLVKRGIPENLAVEELISLIKAKGDWFEPRE
jgi:(E)-4-hydroxy-3-methylbut-2-enyl-diphosphate synthase